MMRQAAKASDTPVWGICRVSLGAVGPGTCRCVAKSSIRANKPCLQGELCLSGLLKGGLDDGRHFPVWYMFTELGGRGP